MERLLLVPGNLDIDRGIAANAWGRLRKALPQADPLAVSRWFAGGPPPLGLAVGDRAAILRRQAAYSRWIEQALQRAAANATRLCASAARRKSPSTSSWATPASALSLSAGSPASS
jgi:hypothetical protein